MMAIPHNQDRRRPVSATPNFTPRSFHTARGHSSFQNKRAENLCQRLFMALPFDLKHFNVYLLHTMISVG